MQSNDLESRFQELIDGGYPFSISQYWSEGWTITKKHLGLLIAFCFVWIFMSILVGMIPLAGTFANYFILSPCLTAGAYLTIHRMARNEFVEFGDFFNGFKSWLPLMLMSMAMYAIIIICLIPTIYYLFGSGILDWYTEALANPFDFDREFPNLPTNLFLIIVLNMIPMIYLSTAYWWAIPMIAFYKLDPWQALETSRKIITRRWFSVFLLWLSFAGFLFVISLLVGFLIGITSVASSILGGLLAVVLFVPLMLIFMCLMLCIPYAAFADVTKLNENSKEEADILDHLVE